MTDPIQVDPDTRIGWIGCGIMGAAMCANCVKGGFTKMAVYSRTPEKCEPLAALGCTVLESGREVAERCGVVITMLSLPSDVEDVIGKEIIPHMKRGGGIIIDMTTSRPQLAVQLHAQATANNLLILDAPVSGGDVGAREGRLSIMCGGDKRTFEAARKLLRCMGPDPIFFGQPGSGQHAKMANQIVGAANLVGLIEGLSYATRAGLDPQAALSIFAGGASSSWAVENYGPRILKGDFSPGFKIAHFFKDLGIAVEEAEQMDIALPGLRLSDKMFEILSRAKENQSEGVHLLYSHYEAINQQLGK